MRKGSDEGMEALRRLHHFNVDICKPLARLSVGVLLASADVKGDEFVFTLTQDGAKLDLAVIPIVEAYFQRADGNTVKFEGEYNWHNVDDATLDTVSVVLPKECYTRNGRFTLSVKVLGYPYTLSTLAMIDGFVRKTSTDSVIAVDPDSEESGSVTWATVPSYWQDHIDSRVDDVNIAMAAAAGNRSAFLYYTDAHWTGSYQQGVKLLKYLAMNTPIKKVIFGGDIIEKESDLAYVDSWREQVSQLPWHHSVAGNHDDSITDDGSTNDLWGIDEAYDFLLKPEVTDDVVRGDKLYYHIDVDAEETRYIFLDTATGEGNILNDPAQVEWLKNTLLSTPAGWHIVAVGHIWRIYSGGVDAGWGSGAKIALDMFDEYNARSGDYSACTGKVEFCIGGHCHWDADHTSDGGIPVILTECESYYSLRSGLSATQGTTTESAVSAIVADYTAGVVKVIRIGRGNSRTVQLDGSGSTEEVEQPPEYAEGNALGTAVEQDGVTLFNNGWGYIENMRYSQDTGGGNDIAASGWDITGYIAAKNGDTIYMKNVEFMDMEGVNSGTDRACVYMFDSDRNYLYVSDNYSPDNLMGSAWASNGSATQNVTQFTIPNVSWYSGVAYIRIGAFDINKNSVIQVNTAIE